jgi:glutamate carboxypeptidase
VLVLEPSYGNAQGAVKTARKGVGDYLVKVTGKASHAGLDFEKGVNAIRELARQIEKISRLSPRLKKGLTVNVGVRQRRVANQRRSSRRPWRKSMCALRVLKDAAGIDKKMRSLRPFQFATAKSRSAEESIVPRWNAPPEWPRSTPKPQGPSPATWDGNLEEAAVGGGSDGNFTAGLGIPTLDGLGGVGDGAHASARAHPDLGVGRAGPRSWPA